MTNHRDLALPDDIDAALALLRETSKSGAVLVFKRSPTCPISWAAEREFKDYLSGRKATSPLHVAEIDVISRRPLARGLTAALDIRHESPQALLFRNGNVVWNDSHDRLTEKAFTAIVDGA